MKSERVRDRERERGLKRESKMSNTSTHQCVCVCFLVWSVIILPFILLWKSSLYLKRYVSFFIENKEHMARLRELDETELEKTSRASVTSHQCIS